MTKLLVLVVVVVVLLKEFELGNGLPPVKELLLVVTPGLVNELLLLPW